MRRSSWKAEELASQFSQFETQPHKSKKYWVKIRWLWATEKKRSEEKFEDRWAALSRYKSRMARGKAKPLGAETVFSLRTHLANLQGKRCCYCRRWLQHVAPARPIEHILPRSHYPQFSLEYLNLAVCCRACKQLKKEKIWGTLPTSESIYPEEVTDYFHPRFHIYDGHIRYIRVETNDISIAIYQGISPQGRHLCREHLHHVSEVDALVNNNPLISKAVQRLQAAGEGINPIANSKLEEFIDGVHQAVYRIAESRRS